MADLLCISREGSYGTNLCNLYIDDATLNNTTVFTARVYGGGTDRQFIKPVGICYTETVYGTTYMSVYGQGAGSNSTGSSDNGGSTISHANSVSGFSFSVEKTITFQEVIPFFNNQDDASYWSRGLEYDASNWVGGKPLTPPVVPVTSNGGGATHIAKVTGQLKDLSSNLSDILIVSGGGGGGLIIGDEVYAGADAGGISGSGSNSADQSTGYAFGQGESGTNTSGGGAGLYGGYDSGNFPDYCIKQWLFGDSVLDMSILTDFTQIPSSLVNATSPTMSRIYDQSYSSRPSFVTLGDVFYTYSGTSTPTDQTVFVESDYIKIVFGKYANTYGGTPTTWGFIIYNKLNNYARIDSYGDEGYGLTRDYWIGVILDPTNQRAYLMVCNRKSDMNYFRVDLLAGMYNGVDLYWETFKSQVSQSGGAGSGYIGNSLLSNKKMVGFNVPTSSAESTKTESVNVYSASGEANKPKAGNGMVRIKFLRDNTN